MGITTETYDPVTADSWLVCDTCGTQFPTGDRSKVKTCHICDDPRQFVPASGQSFSTLGELKTKHKNEWTPCASDPDVTFISSTPRLAIGQRAILIKTSKGNILWDCISLLDDETIERIKKLGGHFPGSMVLHHNSRLFIADTLMTTASGVGNWDVDATGTERSRPEGLNSFSFLWSIPNFIPLGVEDMVRMWRALRGVEFTATHGGFMGMDIEHESVKDRVLESMKIQAKFIGEKAFEEKL
ncbi:hypothetical protein ACHAPQ_006585 [Fusarium lateritium]